MLLHASTPLSRLEPQLDPAFGRGYGEEVDWCQKVLASGRRHLCLAGLFVEHRGGAPSDRRQNRLVTAEWRDYLGALSRFDADVQRFIGDDP